MRSKCGRTRKARRYCATGSLARWASPAAQVNVFPPPRGRRLRPHIPPMTASDAANHCHAPAGPHRSASSSRARTSLPRPRSAPGLRRITLRARARRRPQAGRLADRDLEPATRAASRHERSNSAPPWRRGAAQRPAAQPAQRDVPDERGGGATRNAVAIYDLPRHRTIHQRAARGADPHLNRSAAQRPGPMCSPSSLSSTNSPTSPVKTRLQLPAFAAIRIPAPAASVRQLRMSDWRSSSAIFRRAARPRLRLRLLQEHRLVRRAVVVELEVADEISLKKICKVRRRCSSPSSRRMAPRTSSPKAASSRARAS